MQITPFSATPTPAAVAPGDISDDGAAFEKLMTPFRPAGRESAASDQGKGTGSVAAANKGEIEAVIAYAVLDAADAQPEATGENLRFSLTASVQATPVHWQDAAVPSVETEAFAGSARALMEPSAVGAKTVPEGAVAVVGVGQVSVGTAGDAAEQAVVAAQRPEGATIPPALPGSAEARFAAAAQAQAAPIRLPPADAPHTMPVAATGNQAGSGLAGQTDARVAPPVSANAGEPGPDLPLSAASAESPRVQAASEKANRRPGSPAPTAAQGTGFAAAAEAEVERRVEAPASTYDTSRTSQEAKAVKAADAASQPPPTFPLATTEFRPDPSAPTSTGRDNMAVSTPAATGGGMASPAAPPPASQLSQAIVQIIQRGADSPVEVMLRPEELGKVRFDLITTGDKLHITLFVERPEAMDLIRRHGEQFLNDLRQSGFSQPSLSFGDWSQRDTRPAKPAAPAKPAEGGVIAYEASADATARMVAAGRLDLRL